MPSVPDNSANEPEALRARVVALEGTTRLLGLGLLAVCGLWLTQCVTQPPTALELVADDGARVVVDATGMTVYDPGGRAVATYGAGVGLGGIVSLEAHEGQATLAVCSVDGACARLEASGGRATMVASAPGQRMVEAVAGADEVGVVASTPHAGRARLGERRGAVELVVAQGGGYPSAQLSPRALILRDAQGVPHAVKE